MAVLSRLVLDHFRSWSHCEVDFDRGVNILQGFNGLGKTNIIEAIEVLSTGSSHRASSSFPLVEHGQATATIRANVSEQTSDDADTSPAITTYEATIPARGTNRARIDAGRSLYMRDIVGLIPSVMFAPEDQWLVAGDPSQRRSFLDQSGALLVTGYAQHLQQFRRIAKQRAALLKQLSQGERDNRDNTDATLSGLEIWTGQFIAAGVAVTHDRSRLISQILPFFEQTYRTLAGQLHHNGDAGLSYRPSFEEALGEDNPQAAISQHFQRIYAGEVARGRNLIGPHRDDFDIELNGMPAREFASNGEMWTLALALKMAVSSNITQLLGRRPIMLLDDVFAQLDESRRHMILDFAEHQGQVMITVAAASDIPEASCARVIDVQGLVDAANNKDANASVVEQVHAARMARRTETASDQPDEPSGEDEE